MKTLFNVIEAEKKFLRKRQPEVFAIPDFISQNLKFELFEWQKSAVENFLIFQDENMDLSEDFPNLVETPTHLLFQMATGAGKTLVMAALMLYYYQKGYRHFLFFVNQNNIVDKTENNFVDSSHAKYLFQPKISDGNTIVPIKKVEQFSLNPNGIEIKFTTIQKLYNDVRIEKENNTTLMDLQKLNIVMLADEAHHLNSSTKKGKSKILNSNEELTGKSSVAEIEAKGWEYTVIDRILKKDDKPSENVLLEFTATLPNGAEVEEKYRDKIITQFDLKAFMLKNHTKEINLISSMLGKKERVLHALFFAWYRHQVALKYQIANFKPVMLFRSKDIESSKQDYELFMKWARNCQAQDFDFLAHLAENFGENNDIYQQGKTRTEQALQFMQQNGYSMAYVANWVRENYQDRNVIITNSKTNKTKKEQTNEETERLLNNLEAANNPVRAIFTVDRLTEGWDVLNLFDIVRLYEGTNAGGTSRKSGKTPETTIKEKQLIGRGVRYYPFAYQDKPVRQRKFNDDLNHELRILEELFYYTFDEKSRYITELKAELRKEGFLPPDENKVLATFALKDAAQNNTGFMQMLIWGNRKIDNPNAKKHNAENLKDAEEIINWQVRSTQIIESHLNWETEVQDQDFTVQEQMERYSPYEKVKDIERHIFNKAIHIKSKVNSSVFRFNHLQKKLDLKTRDQLQNEILADWQIQWSGNIAPNADDKLQACLRVLERVETMLEQSDTPFIGSLDFTSKSLGEIFKPKKKYVEKSKLNKSLIENYEWFVLDNFAGTSSEKALIELVKNNLANLSKDFDVHLLRNEEVYKIYDFNDGQGFQPDFLLLLKSKRKQIVNGINGNLYYQILIEPKGEHLKDNDQWKEDFLAQISQHYGKVKPFAKDAPHYRLIGLPFFVEGKEGAFTQELFKNIA